MLLDKKFHGLPADSSKRLYGIHREFRPFTKTANSHLKETMDLTIEIRAKADRFQELYQTLQALLPTFRSEKGCRDCRIYRDVEDGAVFFLSVQWESQENLEHYMRSGSGSALLGAIDLLSETARVEIGNNSKWEEIETLKRIRKLPAPPSLGRKKGKN
jgi:quinol monooxygenase YgiN